MKDEILQILVVPGFVAAVLALSRLAAMERRRLGAARLAPTLFCGFAAAAAGLFYLDDAMMSDRREETVRVLFNLPEDVGAGKVLSGDRNPVCYRKSVQYTTTVGFTSEQMERYLDSIADPDVWRPVSPPHYLAERSRLQFLDGALAWQELPEPGWTGSQQLVWRIAGRDVRQGLALCYAIHPAGRQEAGDPGAWQFSAAPCNARSRPDVPPGGGLVVAALDVGKRQMAVAINFDGKPDYCRNRISRWLASALRLG